MVNIILVRCLLLGKVISEMQESVFLRFLSLILLLRAQGGSSQTASSCEERNICNREPFSQSDESPELLCDVPDFTARIDYESFGQNTLFGLYLQCVNESSMDRLCVSPPKEYH